MKKKILIVETGVYGGGSFVSLLENVRIACEMGIDTHVLFYNRTEFSEAAEKLGAKVHRGRDPLISQGAGWQGFLTRLLNGPFAKGYLPGLYMRAFPQLQKRSYRALDELITRWGIHAVHANTDLIRDRVPILYSIRHGLPLVVHLRSAFDPGKVVLNRQYVHAVNTSVHRYLCVSNTTASFWQSQGVMERKCTTVYDAVKRPVGKECSYLQKAKSDGRTIVACVANFIPVKGHHFLIDVIKRLAAGRDAGQYLFVFAGEGPQKRTIQERVDSLGLNEITHFAGYVAEMGSIYKAADFVVQASSSEGLPRAVLEAMMYRKPVVATMVGGTHELVIPNKTGYLVQYGDVDEMCNAVRALADKDGRRKQMGRDAYEFASQAFSENTYRRTMQMIYSSLLELCRR